MRKASVLLAIAACAASSLSLAQQHRDQRADIASPAAKASTEAASTEADDNGAVRAKSGFGQVMSVLTGLLQEAAARQAAGASSKASPLLSSDQSAVAITVTPVAGRTTFFVDKAAADRNSADQETGQPGRASPTPPAVAVTTIGAGAAAQGAQMAMQTEGDVPD